MHPIDSIVKKYNVTKYSISKIGNISQTGISSAIERNQTIDNFKVKTIIAIAKAINKTPGETLDELLNFEEHLKNEK
ncbi:hypothetical protein [Carnobacterium divergens]|uniref:hypothetical protein n=1 Tax=Carnobacterium divergens TaxID=2748 RepID=UPI0039AFB25C